MFSADRRRLDLLILAGLLLLPLLLFWPVTLGGRTLLPADNLVTSEPWRSAVAAHGWPATPYNGLLSDLVLENYAWKHFALQSLQNGQAPLWNPYLFAGQPFLAAGQHSALYPFSVIFVVLPLWQAYGWFTVSQLFMAGAFTYLFARVLGIRRAGAALAGVTYQLSAFMLASVVFPMVVAGAVWLPLLLASLELLVRRALPLRPPPLRGGGVGGGRSPWLALGALALGCQVLAGHVEITYYTLIVAGLWTVWRVAYYVWRTAYGESNSRLQSLQYAIRYTLYAIPLASALALVILGLSLAAVQFIPLVEYAQQNFRQDSATYEQVAGWALPARHALAFLMPNVFGSPAQHGVIDWWSGQWIPATTNARGEAIDSVFWGVKNYVEGAAYAGILPLLLALLGVASLRARAREGQDLPPRASGGGRGGAILFFAGLWLLALSFAFGLPTYHLIYWLPGASQLHSPFRWVWPATLCVAMLAGFGADYLARTRLTTENTEKRDKKISVPSVFSVVKLLTLLSPPSLITILAGLAFWLGLALALAVVAAGAAWPGVAPLADRTLYGLALADGAFADGAQFFSFEARQVLLFALFLLSSGIVLRVSRCPIYLPRRLGRRPVWEPLALLVVALDLAVATGAFNPSADPAILAYRPPVAEFLAQDTDLWRFTTYNSPKTTATFNANTGMYFDWQDVRGYDSIITRQYVDYMNRIEHQGLLDYNRIAPLSTGAGLDSPFLDLLGVKYVISEVPIDRPDYKLVYDREVKVYENLDVFPRAFFAPACGIMPEATLDTLDLRRQVSLNVGAGLNRTRCAGPPFAPLQPMTVTRYTPNEVWVDATVAEPGVLVLADSYFPGWVAYARPQGAADDQERELTIYRADGNFRAVLLEPGAWSVRFRYSPLSFKLGLFTSFMAAMLLVFVAGVWVWRRVYGADAAGSTAWRIAKNSFAPMAVNLANRLVDFAFAALMLRILGPGDAGKYYFAGVIAGWFEIVTNFGLNTYLTREVAQDHARAGRYLLNTTLLRLALWLGVIPLLGAVLGLWGRLFALGGDVTLAIVLLYLALIPSSISSGLTALFYAFEKAEYPAAVTTVTTLLKVTLGALALLFGFGFVGLAGVAVIVNLATMAVLGVSAWRTGTGTLPRAPTAGGWAWDFGLQREVLRESFPLMLNHLLATLFFKVDVTLLEPMRGAVVVGWYSTGYKFVEAYNIIPAFFTMAFFPVMARQARESPAALQRAYQLSVKFLVMLALPLAVVTVTLAYPLINLLGGAAYLPHGAIALQLMVLSIPIGWINSLTQYVLIALGKQRSLTRAFLIAVTFNVVANLIFIPLTPNGYEAAAVITIFSEIVEGIPFYLVLRRALAPVPWASLLGRPFLAALAMAGLCAVLAPFSAWLAAAAGGALYLGLLVALRVLGPEERAVLRQVLRRG
jgi:O-antigen/teichoic acid export membrane protein